MKELIKLLQILKHSKFCENDGSFRVSETIFCMVRHLGRGSKLLLEYNGYSLYVDYERMISITNDKINIVCKIPYNCEDRTEFFQLSTMYDYNDMNYEDLMSLHELCNFMIKRDLNERKR